MKKSSDTMANINLYAILRNLEDLCKLDSKAKSLIELLEISIYFHVKNGPQATLVFKDGKCQFHRSKRPCDIKLYYSSSTHLNEMFNGNATPIVLKGFTKINFLKHEFTALVDRLTYFLKPTEDKLSDPDYKHINTVLTSYTTFFSLAEIANSDPVGQLIRKRLPSGVIHIKINPDGPSVYLNIDSNQITASKIPSGKPRATMQFDSIATANDVFTNKADLFSLIAEGQVRLSGFIPMIDQMNKLLGMAPTYLLS